MEEEERMFVFCSLLRETAIFYIFNGVEKYIKNE